MIGVCIPGRPAGVTKAMREAWERIEKERKAREAKQQAEAEARKARAAEARAKVRKACEEWKAGWQSESIADIVNEIVKAEDPHFLERYFDYYNISAARAASWRQWVERIRAAYRRKHKI